MCQIQFLRTLKGKITARDRVEFIKLMYLGNQTNNHAYGVFNHSYSVKNPGEFNYRKLDERKVLKGNFLIGHNRFATIGESYVLDPPSAFVHQAPDSLWTNPFDRIFAKTERKTPSKNYNNHPFQIGEFILVHNGTIYNWKKLRKKFKINNQIETDSYTIIWLIDHFFKKSRKQLRLNKIVDAIQRTTKEINGSYSVLLYDKQSKSTFYFRDFFTKFTFYKIGKRVLVGSTNEKNIHQIYRRSKVRKRIPTLPDEIYLVGEKLKKIGDFNIVERRSKK